MFDNLNHSSGNALGLDHERQSFDTCGPIENTKQVVAGSANSQLRHEDSLHDQGSSNRADTVDASGRGIAGSGKKEQLDNKEAELTIADAIETLLPELRAYAKRLCKDDTLADDLVQDTCMKAWSARQTFRSGSEARPWLFRILRNEYYQITRRSWRSVTYDQEKAEQTLVASTDLESASDLRVMKSMLEQLPTNQYEAMLLVVAGGFTYDEVGAILGCSAGTVKSRVSRGREALHHLMTQNGSGNTVLPRETVNDGCVMTSIVADIARIVETAERRAA